MAPQVFLFLIVTFCVGVNLSNGQCVPSDVQNMILFPNATLSWTKHAQETCPVLYFKIHIFKDEQEGYNLQMEEMTLDVSFLPFCQSWIFNVVAVGQYGSSEGHILLARIPIPSDAEVALRDLEITTTDGEARLQWEVENDMYKSCVERYRITVDDEDSGNIIDVYVDDKFLDLDFLSPCVAYEFGVRAIYNHRPSDEGPLSSIEYDTPPARQNPPRLETIDIGVTTVNTTWTMDSRRTNRCPVGRFYVDGGQYFNVSFGIADTADRLPVPIHLHSLRANSMYVIRVSVDNSAGVSNATVVGVQTLDYS